MKLGLMNKLRDRVYGNIEMGISILKILI